MRYKNEIHDELVRWYYSVKRDLPWRKTNDPYKIWISEVMLQQTQVETVKGYYNRFLSEFPTVFDLAQAEDEKLMKMWEGLGYYSRARNLKRAAIMIVDNYEGQMPNAIEKIKKLPGIGPYTAGAILSIAYGRPVPAVDGNVIRVYSRLFQIEEAVDLTSTKKNIDSIAEKMVHMEDPSAYNQSLMELGATICIPKNPRCLTCPIQKYCKARGSGIQNTLPKKSPKKPKKEVSLYTALVRKENAFLVVKRAPEGLLPDMWSLPSVEVNKASIEALNDANDVPQDSGHRDPVMLCIEKLDEEFELQVKYEAVLGQAVHIFTHIRWNMHVLVFDWENGDLPDYPESKWITKEQINDLAFPTAYRKALKVASLL